MGGTMDAFNEYLNVFVAGRFYGEKKGTFHTPEKATNTNAIYEPYDDDDGQGSREYVNR